MSRGLAVSFSGQIASGKTHVSQELSNLLGWSRVGFSDVLRLLLRRAGVSQPTREQLQDLGQSLVARDSDEFCRQVLAQASFIAGGNILIDGVRHSDIQMRLRKLVEPSKAILIHLSPDEAIVAERIKNRGVSGAELRRAEGHIVESELRQTLPEFADYTINSGRPSQEVIGACLAALKESGADVGLVATARARLSDAR
jgi:cytidylate kinase